MKFISREFDVGVNGVQRTEHAVFAVDPRQGNDSALLAVFDNPRSSQELAAFFSYWYDEYLNHAPMEASADPEIIPGGLAELPAGWIRTGRGG